MSKILIIEKLNMIKTENVHPKAILAFIIYAAVLYMCDPFYATTCWTITDLKQYWMIKSTVMLRSHYHDQRHDWNCGLYRGLIAGARISSYQILMSVVVIVFIVQHFWTDQHFSMISTINF